MFGKPQNKSKTPNLDRRAVITMLGAMTCGCCVGAKTAGAQTVYHPANSRQRRHNRGSYQPHGCTLHLAQPTTQNAPLRDFRTSGSAQVDSFFAAQRQTMNRAFGVSPEFLLYDDGAVPNALASAKTKTGHNGGSIRLGMALVRKHLARGSDGQLTLAGIMAHEWNHIVQFSNGVRLRTRELELHSDYMAGWFFANQQRFAGPIDVAPFAFTLMERGDFGVSRNDHHGTPSERADAMYAGLRDAQNNTMDLQSAFNQGLDRVSSNRFA